MKILLVEDNLLNQKVVIFNLRKFNYEVITVTNGFDAINKFKSDSPDLILMDIMLPEMNGFKTTVKIRKIEKEKGSSKQVPIIALTANTLDNDKEKCIKAGMNDFLAKPFTVRELNHIIDKYLRKD